MSTARMHRRGLTLIEMIATITVLAIVAASVLPVVESAGAHYVESVTTRRVADRAAFAMDRVSRVLRETPGVPGSAGLAIDSIAADAIVLTNGTAIRLVGDELVLTIDGRSGVVCGGVEAIEFVATGADGVASTLESPAETRRLGIGMRVNGLTVRTAIFPRAALGSE